MHSVATGYGLPPATLYDWTLSPPVDSPEAKSLRLPDEIEARLRIEKFCDKVTKRLYGNDRDPVGLAAEEQRAIMTSFLARDFEELERQLGTNISSKSSQSAHIPESISDGIPAIICLIPPLFLLLNLSLLGRLIALIE